MVPAVADLSPGDDTARGEAVPAVVAGGLPAGGTPRAEGAGRKKALGGSCEEAAEVESLAFRTADSHYLDECFLLRDAARSLENPNFSPAIQAHRAFRWLMRNVLPHEHQDSHTPPAFVLRRGAGSAAERAVAFLALARQLEMEGCILAAPAPSSGAMLVAIKHPSTSDLYLFDPRLGLAVAGKKAPLVATLKEAQADPDLLKASGLAADEVKRLEAWIVCPLHALSPRMMELQNQLRGAGGIVTLHMNPLKLRAEIADAAGVPTKVWHPAIRLPGGGTDAKAAIPSPMMWLRQFLPKAEGGVDDSPLKRTDAFAALRVPLDDAIINYARIDLTGEILPPAVFFSLQYITREILLKYEVQPRELYLRGQFDPMKRRQERAQIFIKSEALAGLAQDPEFHKERIEWVQKVRDLNANVPDDPKLQAKQRQAMQAIWLQDQFLRWMLETDHETQLDRSEKKTVMTKILSLGVREHLDLELARLRAALSHEEADRAQTQLSTQAKPSANAIQSALRGWEIARSSWSNYYLQRINLQGTVDRQLAQLPPITRLEMRLALLEKLHLDVHRYFHAELQLAECIAIAALYQLKKQGKCDGQCVARAVAELGVDPDKQSALYA